MKDRTLRFLVVAVVLLVSGATASAHITPPVVLVSDRDALVGLLAGARRFFVREIRLSDQQKATIRAQTGWTPDEDFYRFYVGRDADGRLVAATVFVTEYTIHGPVRLAVAMGGDGRVRGVTVVELTEETYPWVKPLIDGGFTRTFVGQDARARVAAPAANQMPQFYGQVIASLVQRAALLFELGVGRADAA
jgi:hypothetical protein